MRTTTLPARIVAAAALPLVGGLSGCLMDENSRLTLGQEVMLEAFQPSPVLARPETIDTEVAEALPPAEPVAADPAAAPPGGVVMLAPVPEPSLDSSDRASWGRTTLLVPVDRTYHPPTYAYHLDHLPRSEMAPYAYPSPLRAVTVPEGGIRGQVVETVAAPFIAVGNAALIVPWMFFEAPWSRRTSPQIEYERYWHDPLETPFELMPPSNESAEPAPTAGTEESR